MTEAVLDTILILASIACQGMVPRSSGNEPSIHKDCSQWTKLDPHKVPTSGDSESAAVLIIIVWASSPIYRAVAAPLGHSATAQSQVFVASAPRGRVRFGSKRSKSLERQGQKRSLGFA